VYLQLTDQKYPLNDDTIQCIPQTQSTRILFAIENMTSLPQYDKEKYKEMILDAAENSNWISWF
jgi:hypothetical protein